MNKINDIEEINKSINVLIDLFKNKNFLNKLSVNFDKDFYYRTKYFLSDNNDSINKYFNNQSNRKDSSTKIGVALGEIIEHTFKKTSKEFTKINIFTDPDISNGDVYIGEYISWEIKTKRYTDECSTTFQGSTHSSKGGNYILFNVELDQEQIPYKSFNNIIKGMSVMILKNINDSIWLGESSTNNSRTSLRIPIELYEKNKYYHLIGSVKDNTRNRKYIKFLPESIL